MACALWDLAWLVGNPSSFKATLGSQVPEDPLGGQLKWLNDFQKNYDHSSDSASNCVNLSSHFTSLFFCKVSTWKEKWGGGEVSHEIKGEALRQTLAALKHDSDRGPSPKDIWQTEPRSWNTSVSTTQVVCNLRCLLKSRGSFWGCTHAHPRWNQNCSIKLENHCPSLLSVEYWMPEFWSHALQPIFFD